MGFFRKNTPLLSSTLAALLLSACGGGGGDDEPAAPANNPPEIIFFSTSKTTVNAGEPVSLNVDANDKDGDTLSYIWSASSGTISDVNPKNPVLYTSRDTCDLVQVTLTVTDGKDSTVQSRIINVNNGINCGDYISSSSSNNSSSSNTTSSNGSNSSSSNTTSSNGSDSSSSNTTSSNGSDSSSSNTTSSNGSDSSSSDTTSSSSSTSSSTTSSSSNSSNPPTPTDILDPGGFVSIVNWPLNSTKKSNAIEYIGNQDSLAITSEGGAILVNNQNRGNSAFINRGDMLQLEINTLDEYDKTYTAKLFVEDQEVTFSVTTLFFADSEPDQFDLGGPLEKQDLKVPVRSNVVTVSGISVPIEATLNNGKLFLNGEEVARDESRSGMTTATVENGYQLQVELTTSESYEESVSATLTIGNKVDEFVVTTKASKIYTTLHSTQRLRLNDEVNISMNHYMVSKNINDVLNCYFTGDVPNGLTLKESGGDCTVGGTISEITAPKELTVNIDSFEYTDSIQKNLLFIPSKFRSMVMGTGQKTSYREGDDANLSSVYGLERQITKQAPEHPYVVDNNNRLLWQDYDNVVTNHKDAISYCQNLVLDDFDKWRLPTIRELQSLISSESEFATPILFAFWSSTPFAGDLGIENRDRYWYIGFDEGGKSHYIDPSSNLHVKCVRSLDD